MAKIQVRGEDRANETMSMPTVVPGDVRNINVNTMLSIRRIPTAINENKPASTLFKKTTRS
jgi:hypothetical protein